MNKKRAKVILEKIEIALMSVGLIVFILGIIFLVSGWTMDIWDLLYEGRNFMLLSSIFFFTSIALAVVNGFVKVPENSNGKFMNSTIRKKLDEQRATDWKNYVDQMENRKDE